MWKTANKTAIENYQKGNGPNPEMGVFWITQGHGEALPHPDKPQ